MSSEKYDENVALSDMKNDLELKEKAYIKHKEFIGSVIKIEDIDCDKVDEQYDLLLKALPNNGKLYKYRSLCGKSFSYI